VDKEEIDALDELRSTNETITASLQNDLLVLQGHHKAITADFEQQKTQLFEALVTKDKLLQELTTLKEMLNANDHVLHEKMKAEQRLHEEKAQKDLNEVNTQPKSRRKGFWNMIKIPFRPIVPSSQHQAVRRWPVTDVEATKTQNETLEREIASIGGHILLPRTISPPDLPTQPPTAIPRHRNIEYDVD
jgi:hypothetical protein